jgi:hypothetical protein
MGYPHDITDDITDDHTSGGDPLMQVMTAHAAAKEVKYSPF